MFLKNKILSFKSKFFLLFVFFQLSACSGSPLKNDEDVWFFPTSANQISETEWNVPIHHWVFEKEEKSITRKVTQKLLSEAIEGLGVSEEQANSPVVRQRLMWFLVDNKRKKQIKITLNGKVEKLSLTEPNGHTNTNIKLQNIKKLGGWQNYTVINSVKNSRNYSGEVQFIPKTGLSIISDVDDTIKISEVLDKKVLIKNTFVNPYRVTEGFPEYYKSLEKQGAYFHYVSASPWQIQPSLKPFMDANYPKGTISLRNFRLKDSSLFAFLKPSTEYKIAQIKNIIERYPAHQFILIGDSGEHDPEVYAKIYELFPKNIKSIQIRAVSGSDLSEGRFVKTFKAIPKALWQVFPKPPA
jgi:phosphatidate phosphatase APP1